MNRKTEGRRKRVMGLCLAGILAAGSVPASAQEPKAGMGRYLEEESVLPDNLAMTYDLKRQEDGTYLLLGMEGQEEEYTTKLYRSADGKGDWTEVLELPELQAVYKGAVSPQGEIFVSVMADKEEENGYETRYAYVNGEGDVSWIELPFIQTLDGEEWAGMDNFLTNMQYTQDGNMIGTTLDGEETVYYFDDATGEVLKTFHEGEDYINLCIAAGEELWVFEENRMRVYDFASGEEKEPDPSLEEFITSDPANTVNYNSSSMPMAACCGEDGAIYLVMNQGSSQGIFRYMPGGSVVEEIIDGKLNSLGDPATGLKKLEMAGDGSFLVLATDLDLKETILCYTFSADTPTVPDKELSIYSLQEKNEIRQAIVMFQKENPDCFVNFQVGMTGEDAVTVSDALRTLNTDIMAGNGPDVLILDGMPVESYIEKGILADMSELVDGIETERGFFENIKNTYATEEGLYAVPSRFKLHLLQGYPGELDGIDSLTALADRAEELKNQYPDMENILSASQILNTLRIFYPVCSVNFLNEDGSLNQDAVREFVSQMKRIFDAYDASAVLGEGQAAERYNFDLNSMWMEYDYSGITTDSVDFQRNTIRMSAGSLNGIQSLAQTLAVNKACGTIAEPLRISGKQIYTPVNIIGVSSRSNHPEEARKLAAFLLSKEALSTEMDGGFSVNRDGFEASTAAQVQNLTEHGYTFSSSSSDDPDSYVELTVGAPTEEELEKLRKLAEEADTPSLTDSVIQSLVFEQTGGCLAGSISEEEAVNAIIQKINLYLAE